MVTRKPRIVIIGAGMAGLSAAHRLVHATASPVSEYFDLVVVEAGNRIGGRIYSSELGGDRVELGATWIHGIGGSPVHKIAERIGALESEKPWERMDGFAEDGVVKAEGGLTVDPGIFQSISHLYKSLMDVAQGKTLSPDTKEARIARDAVRISNDPGEPYSIGAFVRRGLESFWAQQQQEEDHHLPLSPQYSNAVINGNGNASCSWNRMQLEEGVFSLHENTERTYTSAGALFDLDFEAEKEYREFPGEQITIAKGYVGVLKSLASILPAGTIQFGKKIERVVWTGADADSDEPGSETPVQLHCEDGSIIGADHVIITVSLGVLKAGTVAASNGQGIKSKTGLFCPPLPPSKVSAISKLGFGVVNKLFLQMDPLEEDVVYPFLQLIFSKDSKVPWWMRKTMSLCPIYKNSHVLLAWFAGEEALELERLSDEEIVRGVSDTLIRFGMRDKWDGKQNPANGFNNNKNTGGQTEVSKKINGVVRRVVRSGWGFDPLFRGSYSYVAVGSSGQDIDTMAEPLPKCSSQTHSTPPLQLLFAGEATHRTHYSTTHGAYFSGLREADRLLQHYGWINLEPL
eukprot:Gb_02605 [translate_table: standard]